MNAKLRKTVKIAAAGLFLAALAINVKVTLDDPFNMGIANEKALAEQTTGGAHGIFRSTRCICSSTGEDLGPSNNCDPGSDNCNDNDCSAYSCSGGGTI